MSSLPAPLLFPLFPVIRLEQALRPPFCRLIRVPALPAFPRSEGMTARSDDVRLPTLPASVTGTGPSHLAPPTRNERTR